MSKSWAKGSTTRWRKIRRVVLLRDQYRCQLRIPRVCTGKAEQVHHLLGKEHGDDPKFLIASCKPCNLKVGKPGRRSPPHRPTSSW